MASKEAYITGVGQSEVGVRLPRHPLLLTVDAVREALDNAGLRLDQIDGVFTYPGKMNGYTAFSPVGSEDLIEVLGIKSKWHMGAMEQPAQLSAIGMAAMAVKQGSAATSSASARSTKRAAWPIRLSTCPARSRIPSPGPRSGPARSGPHRQPAGRRSTRPGTCTATA